MTKTRLELNQGEMNMNIKHKLSVFAFSILSITSHVSFAADTDLAEVHAIFNSCVAADGSIQCLDNKGKEDYRRLERMTTLMKNALIANPGDPIVRDNILGLYGQAYATLKSHQLVPEWHLPGEIQSMNITVRRTLADNVKFSVVVRASTHQPNIIKQFQIIQYPDKVMIDKEAGIGKWQEYKDGFQSKFGFGIESILSTQKIESGLYMLNIELEDGTKTPGWFLVDEDMTASTSPIVKHPSRGETFHTGNPTFNWNNYVSPQYKPYERRWFWSGVTTSESTPYTSEEKWKIYQENPTIHQATLGIDGNFDLPQDHALAPGNYGVTFNYKELKSFGDIEVGRASNTERSFTIVH
jgi:hypothetical protein